MTAEELYNMELHQELDIDRWIKVMRVPGGWIYQASDSRYEGDCMAVFVPFDNEFMA